MNRSVDMQGTDVTSNDKELTGSSAPPRLQNPKGNTMKKRLNKDKALHRPTQAASLQEFSDANGVPKGVVENVCDCLGYGKERDRQSVRRIFKRVRDRETPRKESGPCVRSCWR